MFWMKHPRPLLTTRAIAMQVVARKAQALRDTRVIIVEKPAPDLNVIAVPEVKSTP